MIYEVYLRNELILGMTLLTQLAKNKKMKLIYTLCMLTLRG